MIFIIFIILGAAALISAGVGVGKGVEGFYKMQKAENIGKSAQEKYKLARQCADNKSARTQQLAKE
ncbi:MAG: hypothetical protein N5P05_001976 [Chroococcopsis gigantea SAG 12.99]|jgi:Sec-independent protein translocase protein TatA|nr:hypothetical protein [Chlorogloea purpurea SAG 13.99]MDV3000370.1 hypothetical protein [Chroococcopsis gigantea SAG 12.99]